MKLFGDLSIDINTTIIPDVLHLHSTEEIGLFITSGMCYKNTLYLLYKLSLVGIVISCTGLHVHYILT